MVGTKLRRAAATMALSASLALGISTAAPAFAWADEALDEEATVVETVVDPVDEGLLAQEVEGQAAPDTTDQGDEQVASQVMGEAVDVSDVEGGSVTAPGDTTAEAIDGQATATDGQEPTPVIIVEVIVDDPVAIGEGPEDLPDDIEQTDEEVPTDTETDPDDATPTTAAGEETPLAAPTSRLNGVDISAWNSYINLGVLPGDFVIIKATEYNPSTGTYTSYTTGKTENTYSSYIAQAQAALAAGKLIGFYHFATNPSRGASYTQQAQGFLDAVGSFIGQAVLVLDWENAERANGEIYSYVESDVSGAKTFLDYIYNKTGIKPLIYMNHSCSNNYDWSPVANAGYELWGAMYLYANEGGTSYNPDANYSKYGGWGAWGARPTIYQYSSTARLNGTGGEDIDVNVFYGTRDDWRSMSGNPWVKSGNDYYYVSKGTMKIGGWLVTSNSPTGAYYGTQRYWLDSTGKLAINRLISNVEAGYWAYARPEGYVVRGSYATDGRVYLADNNGKLANVGWVVSNAYGQGMQRYYIDATAHAAVVGYSGAGWDHYTRPEGYVVRGRFVAPNGYVYLANGDGKLEKAGWLVSNAYGQGLQRYYIDAVAHAAVPGFSSAGFAHYTRPEGYVVRGVYTTSTGSRYMADNNGKLTSGKTLKNGWLVSSEFGQGLQRYWVANGDIVFGQLVQVDSVTWAYARPEGFVVRGRYVAPNGYVYLADNNGKLANVGWVVSNAYGQGLQRYFIDAVAHAAIPGYSTAGYSHFTRAEGYVLRGTISENGNFRSADNNGRISDGWVVTNAFGQGLQRYWQRAGAIVKNGLVQTGTSAWSFARPEGYVVRGKYTASNGNVYLADNNGKLENVGWVVSDKYGDGLQRYYIDPTAHAAIPGYSTAGYAHYTVNAGYVLRSGATYLYNKVQYKANGDGKLSNVGSASAAVVAAANATPAPESGQGFEWVLDVLVKAGLLEAKGYDTRAAIAYGNYCKLTSEADLKVGMIVVVPASNKGPRGNTYGHAAIYIGGGKVIQCDKTISTMTLAAWKSAYGTLSTPKWGWMMNNVLA